MILWKQWHAAEVVSWAAASTLNAGPRTRKARMKGLYDTDVNTQIKKSNENPMILSLYDSLLKGKEHELLHRNFSGK